MHPIDPKATLLFDFDGTLADSFSAVLNIVERLAPEFNYNLPQATSEIVKELRHTSLSEIIKKLNISIFTLPILIKRIKDELNQQIKSLQPIPGIQQALMDLKESGYKLGILTSNNQENVGAFLCDNSLNFFEAIYCDSSLFGKHNVINRFLKTYKLAPCNVMYIGDEVRDIEAAHKSSIKVIAVTWGFNAPLLLQAKKPDFLVSHPSELSGAIARCFTPSATPVPSSLTSESPDTIA